MRSDKENAMLILSMRMKEELSDPGFTKSDKAIYSKMLGEINAALGTAFTTHAELASLKIPGAGEIVKKYIREFKEESIRMELLHLLVSDRVQNCDHLILDLYDRYLANTDGMIEGTFYDNAFHALKPRRIASELVGLMRSPENVYYLPFTVQMLSSWRVPGLKELLLTYTEKQNLTERLAGKCAGNETFVCREILLTVINCLRYYNEEGIVDLLTSYTGSDDRDVCACAGRSLAYIEKRRHQKAK